MDPVTRPVYPEHQFFIRDKTAEDFGPSVIRKMVVISPPAQTVEQVLPLLRGKIFMELSASDIIDGGAAYDSQLHALCQQLFHGNNNLIHRRCPGKDRSTVPVKKYCFIFLHARYLLPL